MPSKPNTTARKEEAKPALVPKLRFPEFRGAALRCVKLGDVTEERRSRNGNKHSVASVMGVTKVDGIVPMEARLIAPDIARYKIVQKDWFAYNPMRLNIGSIARWKGECEILVSPDYVVFKCITNDETGIAPGYLDHFRQTKAWEDFVTEGGDGSVRVRIYYKDIARVRLALPSSAEQQRIAECLSSVDEAIAAQARKLDALKIYKTCLMQQLFPREGETQPRLRFPEFQNAGGWEVKTLVDACKMQAGKFVAAAEIKEQHAADLFPCYGGNGLRGYTASYTHEGVYPLIGRQGALCGNVKLASGQFHATEHAVAATPQAGVDVVWLYYVLDLLNLNKFATGQAQPGLSVDVLEKVPVTIPSNKDEQHRIASCLSHLDALIAAETQKHAAFQRHKRGLMQQLFPSPEEVKA